MEPFRPGGWGFVLPTCSRVFTATVHSRRRMAREANPPALKPASYHGEVWTDARGLATVQLPTEATRLRPPLDYELRDLEPPSSARVTAELEDGRFTIATDQPHVKVAWRIRGRHPAGLQPDRQEEENT